jgi:prepilin-type N-terminal cleavage/methylation domain-containing protein
MRRKWTSPRCRPQSGMSLLEVLIALTILVIASAGIMAVASVAMTTTEDQGHLAARAAEYAQDKMEQLMSLAYGDGDLGAGTGTNTTVFPAVSTGGDGLGVGGSSDPNNPVSGYVDYLDSSGNPLSSAGGTPNNWYYIRVWQISKPAGTTNLKLITVTAMARSAIGSSSSLPRATVASLKAFPF